MKNLSIEAKIGFNGCKPTACEFRIHDGLLFWHGAPKKFSQGQYDKFIWPTNAMLQTTTGELSIDIIKDAISIYVKSGVFGDIKDINFAEFSEPKTINEKPSKLAKFGFGPEASKTTEPTNTTPNEPVSEPANATEPTSEPVTPTPAPEPVSEPVSEPATVAPAPTPQAPSQQAAIDAFAALTPLFAGVQANVQAAVMAQLQPIIEKLKVAANTQARTVKVVLPSGQTNAVNGSVCADFDAMVQTLTEGEYIYLHGPAGCGKSYTAQQLAEALDIPFYGMQQLLYEHQIVGFVDANGKRHETPFSEAYTNGGLAFLDEIDGSSPEAAITINNALANGVIAMPGVGNVKMHPNFRCVAAGNTTMTGASVMYTARQVLDASTIDRFMFVGMDYDVNIERVFANGDESIIEFAHDVRRAMDDAGLCGLFSYRAIKRLGNVNLQQAWGDAKLLQAAFTKSFGRDELRLIYGRLSNTNNRWAMALQSLI